MKLTGKERFSLSFRERLMEVEGWSPWVDQYVKKGVSFGIIPDETADHNGI